MQDLENRNCGCTQNQLSNYNTDCNTNYNDCCNSNKITQSELLEKIKCYNFAVIELGLYLNTHPEDEKALCLHKRYCKILKDLEDKYQKVYGPLSIKFPCNKWRWLERTLALGRRKCLDVDL